MFDFVGKVLVLQPPADHTYAPEGFLPSLPPAPGLFVLREPTPFNSAAATLRRDAGFLHEALSAAISNQPAPSAAAAAAPAAPAPSQIPL